ncbi:MAG TPA: UDP-N-acetylmuramoyl-L-alanyl-D-glutamate--2,6-diaminopimelate ligase [Acidimicrobiales bacterium]|nr:UDP-N-acetylmuramoyl-L-alanyl-D-glutamate--2,6-diaminopimelate ligase [Acidimicrobiales bacterium]
MSLLFADIDFIEASGDLAAVDIGGIAHDSRRVVAGDLFCCVPGLVTDGHVHAGEAVERGAAGIVCEHLIPALLERPVVQARVAAGTMRPVMAQLAATFYGHPAQDLLMTGVTGTNGKTTVTTLLGSILDSTGRPANVLGTLSGARTTPEAIEVQRVLAAVRDRQRSDGRTHAVVMEVSSHALVHARVDGIRFDVAVFTNLSHDHLDFHGTMESYFDAKALLFTPERAAIGVVNADDPWGLRLLGRARIPMVPVRMDGAGDVELGPGRSAFSWRGHRVRTPLTGAVNVANSLLAAEAALALGLGAGEVAEALGHVEPVPGRLQLIAAPSPVAGTSDRPPFTVLVDYAHTPAGLETVLHEARGLAGTRGRVLVVFGCGGHRDQQKRPIMGGLASALADLAMVTSDNPRDEDPAAIIEDVMAGVPASSDHVAVEPDRHLAIGRMLERARPGDVVVVAGKGHETYQEIQGDRLPFDDVEEIRKALTDRYPAPPAAWVPTGGGHDAPEVG